MKLLALMVLVLSGCATPSGYGWREGSVAHQSPRALGEKSVGLEQEMPAERVSVLLGEPTEKYAKICGEAHPSGPWKCVIWTYRTTDSYRSLRVIFQKDPRTDQLAVNGWDWY